MRAEGGGAEGLTESGSLMDTCSEKRTLGGLVRSRAFLAALMKADLGDCREGREAHHE